MNDEIKTGPFVLDRFECTINGFDILDIAWQEQFRSNAFGKRFNPAAKRFTLIGEGQFGFMLRKLFSNTPSDRMIVRDPHDQATLSFHQTIHRSALNRCNAA